MSDTQFSPEEQRAIRQIRYWPRLFAFPVLAIVGEVAFLAGASGSSWIAQSLWIIGLTYCWFCIGGLTHELVHQTLPVSNSVNDWINRILGTFTLLPHATYRLVHVRHHAYLNTPLDFELWPYSDPRCGIWFRRMFVWFDIAFGVIATPLIYLRILTSPESPVPPAERSQMQKEYVYVVLFWGTVAGLLAGLHLAGTIHLTWLHLVRVSPLLLAASGNSLRKIVEHLGMASYDPVAGTRTIIGRHWWTRALSYFDFDLSIHGPHHRYPKRPNHELESTMRQLESRDPTRSYPVFSSFHAALLDVLPWIVFNPAVGMNAGNTAPLTHLPNVNHFTTDVLKEVVAPDSRNQAA